jgi:hypothetical protein
VPVNSHHADYDAALSEWQRARDVVGGEDLVKAAGDKYIPRLDSQTEEDFAAYVRRANFYNATGRTVEGYVGLMFRRAPIVWEFGPGAAHSEGVAAFLDDVDLLGTSMESYVRSLAWEVLTVGRGGTLVDWEETAEQRAFVAFYAAEQIINWRTRRVEGRSVLTMVALREKVEDGGDEFCPRMVDQIRVLRLVTAPAGGGAAGQRSCVVELWRAVGKDRKNWVKVSEAMPLRRGKPLPLIPFVFHGARHSRPDVGAVPLGDLITINLDHYRLDADYKHGLHFTALPTAWVSGFERGSVPRIGSTSVWVSEQPGATAGYLEFVGAGLSTFENAMDRDERMLSMLGTRLLESERKVAETATAIELRQSGEKSVLGVIANVLSESMTQVLRWVIWWDSAEEFPEDILRGKALYHIDTEFGQNRLQSQELQAIVQAWQAGAMSRDTMFELFRHGEILPTGRTNEEELALVTRDAAQKALAEKAAAEAAGGGAVVK